MGVERLQNRLRELSTLVTRYVPDYRPMGNEWIPPDLSGYSQSKLSLAVCKEATIPEEFAHEQAVFMLFLGQQVCPKILAVNQESYIMEYLNTAHAFVDSLMIIEQFLQDNVWCRVLSDAPFTKRIGDEHWRYELANSIHVNVPPWAMDIPCLIHGDPTIDNALQTKMGSLRIGDPIPPHRLMRPSIKAIDHSKILQSLLGWEVVLRGAQRIEYAWPKFMYNYEQAIRATFWCMVGLKRITLRNKTSSAGQWAVHVGTELEALCDLSF